MGKSTTVGKAKRASDGSDPDKRYRSIKISDKTLRRFDQNGAIYTHRATNMHFRRFGDKLKSVSGKGITKAEYCKTCPTIKPS